MTQPQTCGAAGGAISVWVKVMHCPHGKGETEGIVSSTATSGTGSIVYCHLGNIK